jgi:MFS family permease
MFGSLLNVVGQACSLIFIALVRYRGGSPTEVGLVMSVALVGGIAGAVAAPILLKKLSARLVLCIAGWLFVIGVGCGAIAPEPWEIAIALLAAMLGIAPLNVITEAYAVRLVPDALIGRTSAVTRFGSMSLQWTGPLIAGVLADALGAPGAAVALTVALIPFALTLHLTRSLRVVDQRLEDVTEFAVLLPQSPELGSRLDRAAASEQTAPGARSADRAPGRLAIRAD